MAGHTTLAIGGPADLVYVPATEAAAACFLSRLADAGRPVFFLGGGSNLLVADEGYRGAVVKLTRENFGKLECKGEKMRAGAGTLLQTAVERATREGMSGLEFAAGIPGSVGGAAVVNAGAYDGDMSGIVVNISALEPGGKRLELTGEKLCYRYRGSAARDGGLLLISIEMKLERDEAARVAKRVEENIKSRSAGQPLDMCSAGCVFKNPEGKEAWRLVDEAGMKGARRGGAQVSEVHTNFIVNHGGAKAADYKALMEKVAARVEDKFGLRLEREVVTLGFDDASG